MFVNIKSIFDFLINAMATVGRLMLVVIIALIMIDIISLSFLDYSLSWVFELTEYLLLFITFLGAAFVLRRDEHIKLDAVLNLLNTKQRTLLEVIHSCIGLITSLVITIFGFAITLEFIESNVTTEGVLAIPRYLIVAIIPISFTFVTIQFSRTILQKVKQFKELN